MAECMFSDIFYIHSFSSYYDSINFFLKIRLLHKNTKETSLPGWHQGCCVTVKSRYGCHFWRPRAYSSEQTHPWGERLSCLFLVCFTSSQVDWVVTWVRGEHGTQTHTDPPACTGTRKHTRKHTLAHTHTYTVTHARTHAHARANTNMTMHINV